MTDTVVGELRRVAEQVVGRLNGNAVNDDLTIKHYEVATKPDFHELECVDLAQHENIPGQVAALGNIPGLPLFSENAHFLEDLRFYALVLQPQKGAPVYAFRASSPKFELNQSRYFGITLAKGQYDKFDRRLFLFDRHIDCLCHDGFMFLLNKDSFQHIFKFFEMLQAAAEETLDAIRVTVPISNFEEFAAACQGHLQMLKKLKNIAAQPYLARITIADMKRVIADAKLPLKTTGKDGQEKLVFDKKNKWTILKMLDDDYLRSIMTGSQYEVNSKRVQA